MADLETDATLNEFIETIVQRGLGLYGEKEMAKICYDSGIALTDMNEITWMNDNHQESVNKLLINYGSRNLPAKMTAIVLARKYHIPVPDELLQNEKKKKSRFKFIFKRK